MSSSPVAPDSGVDINAQQYNSDAPFSRQYKVLLKKNFLELRRNKFSTIVQLGVPFLFVVFLFLLNFGVKENERQSVLFSPVNEFQDNEVHAIPHCDDFDHEGDKCYSLGYIVDSSSARSILNIILSDNSLESEEVIEFADQDEADAFQYANYNVTQAVIAINVTLTPENKQRVSYDIQFNNTMYYNRNKRTNQWEVLYIPLVTSIERAIHKWKSGSDVIFEVKYSDLPRPELEPYDLIAQAGPSMFFAALMFGVVIQLGVIVKEKENKLREAMLQAGLRDSAYWSSIMCINTCLNFVASLVLILSGLLFQFDFFTMNNFFTYFFLFVLFGITMVPVVIVISAFVDKESVATSVGFITYLIGSIGQGFQELLFDEDFYGWARTLGALFPPILLAKGFSEIGQYSDEQGDNGMSFSDIGDSNWFSLADVYWWLIADFFIWTLLALYLDNVMPSMYGVKKSLYYFLTPAYWTGKITAKTHFAVESLPTDVQRDIKDSLDGADELVLAERQLVDEGKVNDAAVIIQDLVKAFPKDDSYFTAVKQTKFSIPKKTVCAYLGHNGCGKTTTINMLTGLFSPTAGDATIFGYSINSQMTQIRRLMGVCPQHDILFNQLTAREHLHLFGSLKNISEEDLAEEVEARLRDVHLDSVGDVIAGVFSGGMKRRLSVAIALVGDPALVFLDEPTTGMDPVSRRQVWDLIENVKNNRVIFLTTHSMEEAETLGDKVFIMARGQITAVGTPLSLKNKYGAGYTLTVMVDTNNQKSEDDFTHLQSAEAFIGAHLQGLKPTGRYSDQLNFTVPLDLVNSLPKFLKEAKSDAALEAGIVDVAVSLTTLEEVFMKISEKDELDYAEKVARDQAEAGKKKKKKKKKKEKWR
eukprot:GCRY01000120.1.p1 GENE.GCRY01000120.1~~GCRY01000120.1.p1  ORF type:complete len:872 (-),score=243.68 GCRY01000120.1:68-2683(-)